MSDLRLIDEESLTFYCYGCHEHTQNVNHTCEGQLDLMAKRAEQLLKSSDVITYTNNKEFISYVNDNAWDVTIHSPGAIEFKLKPNEDS